MIPEGGICQGDRISILKKWNRMCGTSIITMSIMRIQGIKLGTTSLTREKKKREKKMDSLTYEEKMVVARIT